MAAVVEARWQHIDEIDVTRELVMLLLRYGTGDENAEMADRLVHGIDDRLSVRSDVVDTLVEIQEMRSRVSSAEVL